MPNAAAYDLDEARDLIKRAAERSKTDYQGRLAALDKLMADLCSLNEPGLRIEKDRTRGVLFGTEYLQLWLSTETAEVVAAFKNLTIPHKTITGLQYNPQTKLFEGQNAETW